MNLFEQIREKVKEIPEGKVSTYGEVAKTLGIKDVRKLWWALHQNKGSGIFTCHRAVNKEGEISKGYVFGGLEVQKALLENEGVLFTTNTKVDLEKCLYTFK